MSNFLMRCQVVTLISTILLLLASLPSTAGKTDPSKVPKDAVLLSDVSSLTLRSGKPTAHRRVSAVPQLACIGPKKLCSLYFVDVMRCKNEGSDYNDDNIQWTCKASLPEEFKLGSTDVGCEGYESSDDPYILKGSCGVQYRLALTKKGEKTFGSSHGDGSTHGFESKGKVQEAIFWLIFIAVGGIILLSAFGCIGLSRHRAGGRAAGGNSWGGGGGGSDDPPPPYDWRPPQKPRTRPYSSRSHWSDRSNRGETWRPGFWTGALGGTAAGYALGNRGQGRRQNGAQGSSWVGPSTQDAGEGSSPSPGSSFSYSSYESTGFGSTSRR